MTSTTSDLVDSSATETGEVDAMALLSADHDDVEEMFIDFQELVRNNGSDLERGDLVDQICLALTVHATIEEEIFYPAARDALGDPGLVEQAEQEHASAKALIEQLQGMDPSEDQYDNLVLQLQEAVDQHVQEEEDEMFPQLRDSAMDVLALGMQMAERRDELYARLEADSADR